MEWRKMREAREVTLSRFAMKSADSKGRAEDEEPCPIRTAFERDHNRILYSGDFRRLRHKTQVFFDTRNDHICTRMEHVLYVASISTTIARALMLNEDLAYAIALGHDLGHAPFGHTGERALDACARAIEPGLGFSHEAHSLRVVDRLAARRPGQDGGGYGGEFLEGQRAKHGLNLSFEVRDGIACHCGELYSECAVAPDRGKTPGRLLEGDLGQQTPATLEGCVVRLADRIAYVGRDIEDAIRAGIIDRRYLKRDPLLELGSTNGQIVNTLVSDLIENSNGRDEASFSAAKGQALGHLIRENARDIYKAERIEEYEKSMRIAAEGLFRGLHSAYERIGLDGLRRSGERALRRFAAFIDSQAYDPGDSGARRTLDFIAGMTDNFARQCYEELYWL